ncbi:copper resistance protein CopC [Streptomyces sp. NPDC006733]|uniref:copper resistance CopC/CopD family protein n=1 Tax=Streptomyces sp. NPDC006733 TaxID=3155460 RepID=UPI0033FB25B9
MSLTSRTGSWAGRLRGTHRTATRTLARGAALALILLLALPGAAFSHAGLVASSPSDRAVVADAPRQVILHFSEPVALHLSRITVIGPNGHHLDRGAPTAAGFDGDRIGVRLAPGSQHGTYVVSWRTTAPDDGHTTSGAFTFSVGAPGTASDAVAGVGGRDRLTDAVLDAAIWLGLAGLALMTGFTAVRLYCLPERDPDLDHVTGTLPRPGTGSRRVKSASGQTALMVDPNHEADGGIVTPSPVGPRWPAVTGWTVLLAATLVQLLVYGPATHGSSLCHTFDRSLLATSLSTHVGHALVARMMLLALIAAVGDTILRHRRAGGTAAVVLTLLLALTWSEISHAPDGPLVPLALAVTTVHITAMAVWAGGMVTLVVLMTRGPGTCPAAVATRFSRLALCAVTVLAATGFWQAYREVGSVGALTGTHYGTLLLTKTVLFLLVLATAAVRQACTRRRREPPTPTHLRRSTVLELAGVTAVLIAAVLLIGTLPPHTSHNETPVTTPAPSAATPHRGS